MEFTLFLTSIPVLCVIHNSHFNFGYYVSGVMSNAYFNFLPILLPGGLHECTFGQNTAPRYV